MGVLKRTRRHVKWGAHANVIGDDGASQHIVVFDVGEAEEKLVAGCAASICYITGAGIVVQSNRRFHLRYHMRRRVRSELAGLT